MFTITAFQYWPLLILTCFIVGVVGNRLGLSMLVIAIIGGIFGVLFGILISY